MINYRTHYNPIYKLWELEREQPSDLGLDSTTWRIIACRETEEEINAYRDTLTSTESVL